MDLLSFAVVAIIIFLLLHLLRLQERRRAPDCLDIISTPDPSVVDTYKRGPLKGHRRKPTPRLLLFDS